MFKKSELMKHRWMFGFLTQTRSERSLILFRVGPDGQLWEDGDFQIGGVKGKASQIKVAFLKPVGNMTGALFLTGNRQDHMDVSASGKASFTIHAPLVDAANPFIFVDSATMPQAWHERALDEPDSFEIIEAIRCEGAVKIGLASDIHSARPRTSKALPKSQFFQRQNPKLGRQAPQTSSSTPTVWARYILASS